MLKLKLKEMMAMQGIAKPTTWLSKTIGISYTKALRMLNNEHQTIALKDMSEICNLLQCTPNDLFYWDNAKEKLHPSHPCVQQLVAPPKNAEWKKIFNQLPPSSMSKLRDLALLEIENYKKEFDNTKA